MINTTYYAKYTHHNLYVAAGASKMLSVARALKSIGVRSSIITLPVLGADHSKSYIDQLVSGKDGIPIIFLSVYRNKYLRKLFGALSFAAVSVFLVRRQDKVIIYNHALEYIPALIILAMRKIATFHDVEDLPFKNDFSVYGVINSFGFWFANKLTVTKKIVVSRRVAELLSLNDYLVLNGVSDPTIPVSNERWKRLELSKQHPLCVHYGGTLTDDTGITLFCDALQLLKEHHVSADLRPIHFHITGTGHLSQIEDIGTAIADNSSLKMSIHRYLDYDSYLALLRSCHVSLALKKPDSELGDTTFPSKVFEITSHGLALVSTKVSDIPRIFNQSNSFILPSFTAPSLATILQSCAHSPHQVRDVATSGRDYILQHYNPSIVARALSQYLNQY